MSGYTIPKEAQGKNYDYVFSFAARTKKNLEYIEKAVEQGNGDVYEVTQLINSLMGLIVFPKAAFFDNHKYYEEGLKASKYIVDLIERIKNNPCYKYENTYRKKKQVEKMYQYYDEYEQLEVFSFIRHIRNSLSHEKISVYPREVSFYNKIEGFVFEDEKNFDGIREEDIIRIKNRKDIDQGKTSERIVQKFNVTLSTTEIREVAYDICDILLAIGKAYYNISGDVNMLV